MPTPVYEVIREEKRQRAVRYREQAAQLEMVAKANAGRPDREQLLDMATQYEGLAKRLEEDLSRS